LKELHARGGQERRLLPVPTQSKDDSTMARDVVAPRIYGIILSNPRVKSKYRHEQSVKNAISQIHKQNYGVTMNASAYEFARRNGFSIWRSLKQEDKLSLRYLKSGGAEEEPASKGAGKMRMKDARPDFETPFIKEANDNARVYPYIYVLENSLRSAILERFGNGLDWWNNKRIVSDDVRDYAARIQQAERKYPWLKQRGSHPVYYVGLFELFRIIERNWKTHFDDVFPDLEQLRAWIKESVPIRNLVAHSVRTRLMERQNIVRNADYVCRLVERWHAQHRGSQPRA
jgi:hypothetical protein